jgi:hypothetical protein
MNGVNGAPAIKNGFFRSSLFIFLMGVLLAILCNLVLFSFTWGKISQQFGDAQAWRATVDKTITRMDNEGTRASEYEIKSNEVEIHGLEVRLKDVEGDARKIDVMAEKISRIDDTVKEIKAQQSKR